MMPVAECPRLVEPRRHKTVFLLICNAQAVDFCLLMAYCNQPKDAQW